MKRGRRFSGRRGSRERSFVPSRNNEPERFLPPSGSLGPAEISESFGRPTPSLRLPPDTSHEVPPRVQPRRVPPPGPETLHRRDHRYYVAPSSAIPRSEIIGVMFRLPDTSRRIIPSSPHSLPQFNISATRENINIPLFVSSILVCTGESKKSPPGFRFLFVNAD